MKAQSAGGLPRPLPRSSIDELRFQRVYPPLELFERSFNFFSGRPLGGGAATAAKAACVDDLAKNLAGRVRKGCVFRGTGPGRGGRQLTVGRGSASQTLFPKPLGGGAVGGRAESGSRKARCIVPDTMVPAT